MARIMDSKPKTAFIGLGAMGMGMALHLLKDGFPVSGFDVNPKALETLHTMGGIVASSPRECVQDSSILICMVANSVQTENAFFTESTGAVFGLKHNAIVILCSTVTPGFPQETLGRIQKEFQRPDIQMIDCPVSGGTVRAAQGSLAILSSGPREILDAAQPVLESMSEKLYEIKGGLGAANKVKLINQHLAGVHIAVAAEAIGLAATLGLNTKRFYETALSSPAKSWMFENRVPHMLSNDWTPHSALSIFVKDLGIVTSEGLNQEFPLYIASAAEQLYQFAARLGYEREDDAGLVRIFVPQTPSLVSTATKSPCHANDNVQISESICQLLEIVHATAAVEALALGKKLGLSISDLMSIISNAAGASESFKRVSSKTLARYSVSGCTIAQMRNKLKEVITLSQTQKYPLQITTTTFQLLQQAVIYGLGDEDETALLRLWTNSNCSNDALNITKYEPMPLAEKFATLPKYTHNTENVLGKIQDHLRAEKDFKLVVLDDDPTGTQTCHDINVLTMWDIDLLATEFCSEGGGFFILTNSRALPSSQARKLVNEILRNVSQAASLTGKRFEIVLRGDSTLRGHFLEEIESYIDTIRLPDAWVLAPFFEQGARYTIDDIHYVGDQDTLVPAAETPFAKDKTFGYRSSNLREWVYEKAGSRFSGNNIVSVTLDDIRLGGLAAIEKSLLLVPKGGILIVNAAQAQDMLLFCLALLEVRKKHKLRFGYRTGASFVSSRLGIPQIPQILPKQIPTSKATTRTGGLIVAGSYVPKSTKQIQSRIERLGNKLTTLIVEVPNLLTELKHYPDIPTMVQCSTALKDIIKRASESIEGGKDVLLMTSRDLVTIGSVDALAPASAPSKQITNLDINNLAAMALVHVLRHVRVCPRYLLAKGGVTSSDAATAGIAIKRAKVLGQAAPGVPIWWCENEEDFKSLDQGGRLDKWTELPLIIFPGNVGNVNTLAELVERWAL